MQVAARNRGDAVQFEIGAPHFFVHVAGRAAGHRAARLRRAVAIAFIVGHVADRAEIRHDVAGEADIAAGEMPEILDRSGHQILRDGAGRYRPGLAGAARAADRQLVGRAVVIGADGALRPVIGGAHLHVEDVVAIGDVQMSALGLGRATHERDILAIPFPQAVIGIVEVDIRRDRRIIALARIVIIDVDAGFRRCLEHPARLLAEKAALGIVGAEIDLQQVAGLPAQARVDVPEFGGLPELAGLQEEGAIGEGTAGHDAIVVDGQVDRDHAAGRLGAGAGPGIAHLPVHDQAIIVALRLGPDAIQGEMQLVARPPFQRRQCGDARAVALRQRLTAQARDERGAELVARQARRGDHVHRLACDQAMAGIVGHDRGIAEIIAARIAGAQIAVAIAQRLIAIDARLGLHARDTDQDAERVGGVARDDRAARADLVVAVGILALRDHRDMRARLVERPRVAQIDGAGDAAFQRGRRRALRQIEPGEQFRREEVQVDFAIGAAAVGAAVGRDLQLRSVQQHAGEARPQAADRDLRTFAVNVAVQAHARHAIERFGKVGRGQLADILGKDGVAERHRILLGVGSALQRPADAGHDDVGDFILRRGGGGLRRGVLLRESGLRARQRSDRRSGEQGRADMTMM